MSDNFILYTALPDPSVLPLSTLPTQPTVYSDESGAIVAVLWPLSLQSLKDDAERRDGYCTPQSLAALLAAASITHARVVLPLRSMNHDQLLRRRIRWLAAEFRNLRTPRESVATGRKALLQGMLAGIRSLDRRRIRFEWRWWWLQRWLLQLRTAADPTLRKQPSVRWMINDALETMLMAELTRLEAEYRKTSLCGVAAGYFDWTVGAQPGLVSIVLPVYNQAAYIEEAIAGVLAQTYSQWELIVVNDGSTDGVETVLRRYAADARIKIYHRPHQGLPAALTFGFRQARGEFYTWTSADNVQLPRQLERLVEYLTDHTDVHFVYSNEATIDELGAPYRRTFNEPNKFLLPPNHLQLSGDVSQLNWVNNFIGASFLYRAVVAHVIGAYDGEQGVEDYDYFMRINALFTMRHLDSDEILYQYRYHRASLTGENLVTGEFVSPTERLMTFEREVRQPLYHLPYRWWEFGSLPRRLHVDPTAVHLVVVSSNALAYKPNWHRISALRQHPNVVVVGWLDRREALTIDAARRRLAEVDWLVSDDPTLIPLARERFGRFLGTALPVWDAPFVQALVRSTVVRKRRRHGR